MGKVKGDDATLDMFVGAELFPVLTPAVLPRALDFNRRVANAMSEAIKESGKTRAQIAAEMTEILAYDEAEVTVFQLNTYTSAARETHNISLVRWKAFIRATGCLWLWEVALEGEGIVLMQGREALLAQATLARKLADQSRNEAKAYEEEAKRLETAAPLTISRGRAK